MKLTNVERAVMFSMGFLPPLAILPGWSEGSWVFCIYDEPKRVALFVLSWSVLAFFATSRRKDSSFWNGLRLAGYTPVVILIFCFIAWTAMGIFFAPVKEALYYEFLQYVTIFIFLPLQITLFKDRELLRTYLLGLLFSWTFISMIGLLQLNYQTGPLIGINGANGSFFGSRNAAALGLSGQFFLTSYLLKEMYMEKRYPFAGLCAILLTIELVYLTTLGSRTAYFAFWVTAFSGLLLWAAGRWRAGTALTKAAVPAVSIAAFILALAGGVFAVVPQAKERGALALKYVRAPSRYFESERWVFLRNSLEMAKSHPVMGVGLGNWGIVYPIYRVTGKSVYFNDRVQVRRAHCDYAQILAETGFVGLVLWVSPLLLTMINGITRIMKHEARAPSAVFFITLQLIAFALLMMFDYPLQMPYHKFLFYSILAAGGSVHEV